MDTFNTGTFLRQNVHYPTEMDLIAIIRRIDTDGDSIVTYSEFLSLSDQHFHSEESS